jgi:hypothetical protein
MDAAFEQIRANKQEWQIQALSLETEPAEPKPVEVGSGPKYRFTS